MSRTRKSARLGTASRRADRRPGDPIQAKLLAAIALALGLGAIILPLPLGLAGMLLAGWGVWRHGRTRFGLVALVGVGALTAAGIVLGMAL